MMYVCTLQRPARKSRQAYALMLCVCVFGVFVQLSVYVQNCAAHRMNMGVSES